MGITQHGCGSDAQFRYHADGRERPLRVDDALALAEAAGLEAEQVWPDVDLIEVYGNLFESTVVRGEDATPVLDAEGIATYELAPRPVPVGIVGSTSGSRCRSRRACCWRSCPTS